MTAPVAQHIMPTDFIDSDNIKIIEFSRSHSNNAVGHKQKAVSLYYAVRDGIRYDPYSLDMTVEGLRASTTLRNGRGWCVTKAILLAACCRVAGIPARVGFADVRNHLTTERLRQIMKTDVFFWHGYTSIFLAGLWVKATPAFNIELCEKFKIRPLEFDGTSDSIYHPFDLEGKRHMEYLNHRGEFDDVPMDQMIATFLTKYSMDPDWKNADFDSDVDKEVGHGSNREQKNE
jgi:transglutaminase-like putative cysteine protease